MASPCWRLLAGQLPNERRIYMLYGRYQHPSGKILYVAKVKEYKKSGGYLSRFSVVYKSPHCTKGTKHHFSFAKAAQYYLDDVADKYEWRCIGTNEKLPVMEINQIYRYKKG